MQIRAVHGGELAEVRPRILSLIRRHGERRITVSAVRWLLRDADSECGKPGCEILIAFCGGGLAGFSCVSDYGKRAAFLVVHPACRGRGIAKRLIGRHLADLSAYTCSVAWDNAPSVRMCRGAGLKPAFYRKGPGGKPTIVFQGSLQGSL